MRFNSAIKVLCSWLCTQQIQWNTKSSLRDEREHYSFLKIISLLNQQSKWALTLFHNQCALKTPEKNHQFYYIIQSIFINYTYENAKPKFMDRNAIKIPILDIIPDCAKHRASVEIYNKKYGKIDAVSSKYVLWYGFPLI